MAIKGLAGYSNYVAFRDKTYRKFLRKALKEGAKALYGKMATTTRFRDVTGKLRKNTRKPNLNARVQQAKMSATLTAHIRAPYAAAVASRTKYPEEFLKATLLTPDLKKGIANAAAAVEGKF